MAMVACPDTEDAMPHLQFDLNFTPPREAKRAFASAVVSHFAAIMDTGTDHIGISIRCFGEGDLTFGRAVEPSRGIAFLNADIRLGRTRRPEAAALAGRHRRARHPLRGPQGGGLRHPHRARRGALPALRPGAAVLVDGGGPAGRRAEAEAKGGGERTPDTYKFALRWSPDSGKMLWSDKNLRLQFVDVASGTVTQVAQAKAWEITDYAWSPDSQWIAYSQQEELKMQTIYLYSCEKKETFAVTDGWFDSGGPAFSEDGKYLFFISDRTFNPNYGQTEFNYSYSNMSKIYLVTLAKATRSPFEPKSDEVKIKEAAKEPAKDASAGTEKKPDAQPKPAAVSRGS